MSPEKTKFLIDKYSKLFYEDEEGTEMLPFPMFGFECRDGWFVLLDNCLKEISDLNIDGLKMDQIKEKFGTLRIYTNFTTDELWKLITKYEEVSEVTCEVCGKYGTLSTKGWWMVLCEEHKKG